MLYITVKDADVYDEDNQEFIKIKGITLAMEHSLVSISKWESKYQKPFITDEQHSLSESIYYYKCMTITQNVPDIVFTVLTDNNVREINEYIGNPMTATTFHDFGRERPSSRKEIITSELVYYWMIASEIPKECEKWHFNRLMTLIRVCSIKNNAAANSSKMNRKDTLKNNAALNKARREKYNTSG